MENKFQVFILTNGEDKTINCLISDLAQHNFTVHKAEDINSGLSLLNDIKPDCLLFDDTSFIDHRHALFSKIEEKEQLQGLPIGIITIAENGDCFKEWLKFGVADIIIQPITKLLFTSSVKLLAELGYYRMFVKRNAELLFCEGN